MWDSNAPLQLLKSMPDKLSKENLEKIQLVIDADKYKNSLVSGFDLCGMYAPFCRGCKKTSIYPCAIAYINMMKADGMKIDIDAKPVNTEHAKKHKEKVVVEKAEEESVDSEKSEEKAVSVKSEKTESNKVFEQTGKAEQKPIETEKQEAMSAEESNSEEILAEQEAAVSAAVIVEEEDKIDNLDKKTVADESQPVKRKIRIAVARRKL